MLGSNPAGAACPYLSAWPGGRYGLQNHMAGIDTRCGLISLGSLCKRSTAAFEAAGAGALPAGPAYSLLAQMEAQIPLKDKAPGPNPGQAVFRAVRIVVLQRSPKPKTGVRFLYRLLKNIFYSVSILI